MPGAQAPQMEEGVAKAPEARETTSRRAVPKASGASGPAASWRWAEEEASCLPEVVGPCPQDWEVQGEAREVCRGWRARRQREALGPTRWAVEVLTEEQECCLQTCTTSQRRRPCPRLPCSSSAWACHQRIGRRAEAPFP